MFLATRPSALQIARFLEESATLPLSYAPAGLLDTLAPARIDRADVPLGSGEAVYDRAVTALGAWRQFEVGWMDLWPREAPTAPGTVVVVVIRHLGFWSMNGCRVVYRRDDPRIRRRGYAYGTLPNHAEAGEESFDITFDRDSGAVTYHIRATSWPHAALARLGQPFVRHLQARFRRDSGRAMRRAVEAE